MGRLVAEIYPSRSRKSEGFKTRVVIQLCREFHDSEVDLTTGKLLAVVPLGRAGCIFWAIKCCSKMFEHIRKCLYQNVVIELSQETGEISNFNPSLYLS